MPIICKNIEDIINFIEENLSNLSLFNKIGDYSGYSTFYIHKIFSKLLGYPLMTYVRKRRLAKSLFLLTETELNIIDIALQSGFSYEQSYIRAFKEEFKITPSKYRKCILKLQITPKISLLDIQFLQSGLIIPPERVFLPELNLIGLKTRINENDNNYLMNPNKTGMKFINEDSFHIKGEVDRSVYYSKVIFISPNKATCDYIPSYICGENVDFPDYLTRYTENPSEYIIFKYIGNHSPYIINMKILNDIYTYIYIHYNSYLNENCHKNYKFERVAVAICSDDYCEMDFLYPVTNNQGSLKKS